MIQYMILGVLLLIIVIFMILDTIYGKHRECKKCGSLSFYKPKYNKDDDNLTVTCTVCGFEEAIQNVN